MIRKQYTAVPKLRAVFVIFFMYCVSLQSSEEVQFVKASATKHACLLLALDTNRANTMWDATDTSDSVNTKTSFLEEITVTAPSDKQNEIIPPQKLTAEDLQRLNSLSVADAVRYFSGVQIKDYGGIGGLKTIDIRSLGTNHTGVFYDGIQLGNAQNGTVDLGKYSLDNIEEITLYSGQKSDLLQTAKDFGGANSIYLRSKRPAFKDKDYNLKALFRSGSFGLINPSILWEQKISNSLTSSLNTEYINSTGKYKFRYHKVLPNGETAWDTTATRENGDIKAFRIEGNLHLFIQNDNFLSDTNLMNATNCDLLYSRQGLALVKAYFYNSERGIPGAIVNNVWKHHARQWDRNFFLQTSLNKEVSSSYKFMINAKYSNDYMRYFNPDTTLMYVDNSFLQQEAYMSLSNHCTIYDWWNVTLATDFQWNKLESNLYNFISPQRLTAFVAAATAFDFWTSALGNIKAQMNLLATFVSDKLANATSTSMAPHSQGSAIVSYKPFADCDFTLRGFYKNTFRMPTFNDLYYTDVGNSLLKPERATQYNIGLQGIVATFRNSDNGTLELGYTSDAYHSVISDKIVAIPKGNSQFRWMMMNIGYVKIWGIDTKISLTWQGLGLDASAPRYTSGGLERKSALTLRTNINYTYQKAQDFSDPSDNDATSGTYGKQIAYIPWHSGAINFWADYAKWSLNYSFIYVGERYHNSANIPQNHEQPWYTSDISISKEFEVDGILSDSISLKSKTPNNAAVGSRRACLAFKITFEINNLLNQYYDVILNYPMPGRNYKLILSAQF